MAADPSSRTSATHSLGANSLEGSLADHLAFCAAALAEAGQSVEASFVLAEARAVQAEVLRKAAEATGDQLGLLLDEQLVLAGSVGCDG